MTDLGPLAVLACVVDTYVQYIIRTIPSENNAQAHKEMTGERLKTNLHSLPGVFLVFLLDKLAC